MAWLLKHTDRLRYRLAMALYSRTAGPHQLKTKVGWAIRWDRLMRPTRSTDLVAQVFVAALVAWAAQAWAQHAGMTAMRQDLVLVGSFTFAVLAWEIAGLIHRRLMAKDRIPNPLRVISDAQGHALAAKLMAINTPYHHAFCLLEAEGRLLNWLLKDLSHAKLRQHDLGDLLPKADDPRPPRPRF